mmetsp:Transcript_3954/g.9004  ORF Transcript_3954/g.9004 Transcript_3954/m.9004 type:complete len:202 (-) Transcript_3954:552-1157(-)
MMMVGILPLVSRNKPSCHAFKRTLTSFACLLRSLLLELTPPPAPDPPRGSKIRRSCSAVSSIKAVAYSLYHDTVFASSSSISTMLHFSSRASDFWPLSPLASSLQPAVAAAAELNPLCLRRFLRREDPRTPASFSSASFLRSHLIRLLRCSSDRIFLSLAAVSSASSLAISTFLSSASSSSSASPPPPAPPPAGAAAGAAS